MTSISFRRAILLGLSAMLFAAACDPFADDELPLATVFIQQPFQGSTIVVGEPFRLRATVRTAIDVDSLAIRLTPRDVEAPMRFAQTIPTPPELSTLSEFPTDTVLDTTLVLNELPHSGTSDYQFSLEIHLPGSGRKSGNVKLVKVVLPPQ